MIIDRSKEPGMGHTDTGPEPACDGCLLASGRGAVRWELIINRR